MSPAVAALIRAINAQVDARRAADRATPGTPAYLAAVELLEQRRGESIALARVLTHDDRAELDRLVDEHHAAQAAAETTGN